MKQIYGMLADYNMKADFKVLEIVSSLPEEAVRRDLGTFFKSILGTLEHTGLAALNWMKRLNDIAGYTSISGSDLHKLSAEDIQKRIEADYRYCFQFIKEIDALLVEFVNELKEEELSKRIRFRNYKGEEMERDYWSVVMHIFNHGTHHRGAISAMLDILKVDNDYSGINAYTG